MSEEGVVTEVEVPVEQPVEAQSETEVQQETVDESQEQQEPKKEGEPLPKGIQKRIDRAVRQKYEAEARAKMLEERLTALEQQSRPAPQAPQKMEGAPTIEQFDNFDDYVAAKAEWVAEQKIKKILTEREEATVKEQQQRAQQEVANSWQKRIIEATAEMPDFEDVVGTADIPMTPVMRDAIMDSELGPKVAYYLASNPEEGVKISKMSPLGQIRALGRIEAKLEQGTASKVASSAPPPPKTVGGRATVKVDPDKMSTDEWLKWRQEQIKKRA